MAKKTMTLTEVTVAVSLLSRESVDRLIKDEKTDLYVKAAAHVLECSDEEVTDIERTAAKVGLFTYIRSGGGIVQSPSVDEAVRRAMETHNRREGATMKDVWVLTFWRANDNAPLTPIVFADEVSATQHLRDFLARQGKRLLEGAYEDNVKGYASKVMDRLEIGDIEGAKRFWRACQPHLSEPWDFMLDKVPVMGKPEEKGVPS